MSLRALKTFAVALSLVACANEMQEIGAPEDSSGGSGSGASGGEASGGTDSGSPGGTSSTGSGSTGGTSSTGSGGKGGGTSGAFGGSAGVGSGGTSGGNGGAAGGVGGAGGSTGGAGGASGSGGSGGSGGGATADCTTAQEWKSGTSATPAIPVGGAFTFMGNLYLWKGNNMGTGDLMYFHQDCPPEGDQMSWCGMQYVFELVGPCE